MRQAYNEAGPDGAYNINTGSDWHTVTSTLSTPINGLRVPWFYPYIFSHKWATLALTLSTNHGLHSPLFNPLTLSLISLVYVLHPYLIQGLSLIDLSTIFLQIFYFLVWLSCLLRLNRLCLVSASRSHSLVAVLRLLLLWSTGSGGRLQYLRYMGSVVAACGH